jgi:hypothetical protein
MSKCLDGKVCWLAVLASESLVTCSLEMSGSCFGMATLCAKRSVARAEQADLLWLLELTDHECHELLDCVRPAVLNRPGFTGGSIS